MQAVEGKLEEPKEPKKEATADKIEKYKMELVAYNKIEYYPQGLIASSVTPEVRKLITMCTTTKQMWKT